MAKNSKPQTSATTSNRNKRIAEREAKEKQKRQRRIIFIAIGAVAVLFIGALSVRAILRPKPGEAVANMGNAHIEETQVGTDRR